MILQSEIEKISNLLGDKDRPQSSKGSKPNSSTARKKKVSTSAGVGNSAPPIVPTMDELSWSIKIISTDPANVTLSKDTEKEDRFKAMKESWETAAPGRGIKSKDIREAYMKLTEVGSIRPVKIILNDTILKPWSIAKREYPLACLDIVHDRASDVKIAGILSSKLEKKPSGKATSTMQLNEFTTESVADDVLLFSPQSIILQVRNELSVLDGPQTSAISESRTAQLQAFADVQSELIQKRILAKENRSNEKRLMIDAIDLKIKECEFYHKIDLDRREEYKKRVLAEIEENNLKLKLALEQNSKLADVPVEVAQDDAGDKKKKATKK